MKKIKTMFGIVTSESRVKTLEDIYRASGTYFVVEDGQVVDFGKDDSNGQVAKKH